MRDAASSWPVSSLHSTSASVGCLHLLVETDLLLARSFGGSQGHLTNLTIRQLHSTGSALDRWETAL